MTILRDAIDHLTAAEKLLEELGPLEDATDKASAEYAQTATALTEIKGQLNDAKAGLSLAHVKNLRDYEESIFAKAQQSKDLDAKISDQQTRLDTLRVEVAGAEARHQQIEDSINSLRQRIG